MLRVNQTKAINQILQYLNREKRKVQEKQKETRAQKGPDRYSCKA